MIFTPGQTIVRRYFRAETPTWVQPMTVVADDDCGLLLWCPEGSDFLSCGMPTAGTVTS